MRRAYYSNTIHEFLQDQTSRVLGELSRHHNHALEELQRYAWLRQIEILKEQLTDFTNGQIYFEFAIPRMGKRVDNVLIINGVVFIIEFKVGESIYPNSAIEQVIDYTLDLKNFHEASHEALLIPVLVATDAGESVNIQEDVEQLNTAARTNENNLSNYIKSVLKIRKKAYLDPNEWEESIYKPTPTIVEAAQALYKGHNVQEISRSDAGAINLSKTANSLNTIIDDAKDHSKKAICFVTGVPGAGKTLAGLNIANERMKSDEDEHAVFLSGNGPLVEVLREALTRDEVNSAAERGEKLTKKKAAIKANAFIQNIHHFRDDNIISDKAPIEKVVVFDEAQRAWNLEKTSSFMKSRKGKVDFNKSEPEFLIEVMDRHDNWGVIVCLIGGGQEINTGEAGLEAWIEALKECFSNWEIYYSDLIRQNNHYIQNETIRSWLVENGNSNRDLHLSVSVRSFRSEKLSSFVEELLEINKDAAIDYYDSIKNDFPILITRDLDVAKNWLRGKAKGSERTGIVASSNARRLKPHSIDVKNEISPSEWFLNGKRDVRSSYFMESVATEFDIQGLEIDWVCLAWGADFNFEKRTWNYRAFRGTKWQNINKPENQRYLKNAYRVLLTRARQGVIIYIPKGSEIDHTRPAEYYDGTFNYLKSIGIAELEKKMFKDLILSPVEIPQPKIIRKGAVRPLQYTISENQLSKNLASEPSTAHLKIGKYVKQTLYKLILNDVLSEEEIKNLQRVDYSKRNFDLQYPLLKKALKSDPENIPRYWSGKVKIKDEYYFICSEWYENERNNDRPYFESWLSRIKEENNL